MINVSFESLLSSQEAVTGSPTKQEDPGGVHVPIKKGAAIVYRGGNLQKATQRNDQRGERGEEG